MYSKILKFFFFVFMMVANVGCSEELNFDQADDLEVVPTLASSIFYFESTEEVINQAPPGAFYSELFTFEAFSEAFIADRILDGVITYQLENTTSKQLNLEIEFLDDMANVLDVEMFTIQPTPAPITEIQIAYGEGGKNLDILKNTRNIRVNALNQGNNSSVSAEPEPKIILRSSAAFRVKLQ